MEMKQFKAIIEGIIFASGDEGVTLKEIQKILELDNDILTHLIDELKYDYEEASRGIMLIESKHALHLTTKPEHSEYYQRLLDQTKTSRLSQAALETLAIIAYIQPITRTEIEEIRGVKSDRSVHTLLTRGLIEEQGRKEGIGRPVLFGTSIDFLTYFGLKSIEELPPLPENIQDMDIENEADLFFERFQDLENEN
ncbi:SMC-Scp complex subunit ScpB [Saliterribacillus persicus]|uniref:Segregation and condensation protein B n=1 Tax=Saliterribacillus persicus TaxID=930114 RepID=A0A368XEH4_9BACI|nr:SMC-Scp complex subunit ScpB [Saliterribacillus persicus]RCW64867.1 condensin subunit ScpB [Saliterribacillus persicus]